MNVRQSDLNYRPDIDGLRALAILGVVLYHAFPTGIPGGFIGVDIFFVISGYLISCIILDGIQQQTFSFTSFYSRRIRRIFPALFVVLAVTYAFGWVVLFPTEFKQLAEHIAAGAGFAANFLLMHESGYFETTSDIRPLIHLWSLAVEEQFYLVYPFLIWTLHRFGINIRTAIWVCLLGSFGLNILGLDGNPTKLFFAPQMRFWELMVGAAIASYQKFDWSVKSDSRSWLLGPMRPRVSMHLLPQNISDRASLLGFVLAVGSMFFIQSGESFPGWWALLPTSAAALIILAGPHGILNRAVLSNRAMVSLGLISYPLYLWHWPLFSFSNLIASSIPPVYITLTVLLASCLLAYLTYQLLEKRIRFKGTHWGWTAGCFASILIIFLLSLYTVKSDGFPSPDASITLNENDLRKERDLFFAKAEVNSFSSERVNIAIFGDSQAQDIFNALRNDPRIGLKIFPIPFPCTAFFAARQATASKDCRSKFETFLDSEEIRQAQILIYAHMWEANQEDDENYAIGMAEIRHKNPHAKIYFFGQKPILAKRRTELEKKTHLTLLGINDFLLANVRPDDTSSTARQLAHKHGAVFVDVSDIFCRGGCIFYEQGRYSYMDFNHWTQYGAKLFYDRLAQTDVYRSFFQP